MASGKSISLRIPILLLALADLALLAMRLRPWNEITNLPGQGTVGFDPLICLLTYFLLMTWMSGNKDEAVQKALAVGSLFGLVGGALSVGAVLLNSADSRSIFYMQIGLLVAAAVSWGIAGSKGAHAAKSINQGIVAGVWSAMVSALIACGVILSRIDMTHPMAPSQDPWKQYQGLAIGNDAIQYFVHSLVMVAGFLLICPIVGGVLGLIFAMSTQD